MTSMIVRHQIGLDDVSCSDECHLWTVAPINRITYTGQLSRRMFIQRRLCIRRKWLSGVALGEARFMVPARWGNCSHDTRIIWMFDNVFWRYNYFSSLSIYMACKVSWPESPEALSRKKYAGKNRPHRRIEAGWGRKSTIFWSTRLRKSFW